MANLIGGRSPAQTPVPHQNAKPSPVAEGDGFFFGLREFAIWDCRPEPRDGA